MTLTMVVGVSGSKASRLSLDMLDRGHGVQ